jgi:hypothetical protein
MDTTDTPETKPAYKAAPEPKPAGKRRATTRAQRLKHLREWEASGLSAEAFASARALKAQSLYRWRHQEKPAEPGASKAPSGGFARIELAGLPSPASGRPEATLRSADFELTITGCDVAALLPGLLGAFARGAGNA